MCHTTEFTPTYLTVAEAQQDGFTVLVIKAVKMRQRVNREAVSHAMIDLKENGCVVRDPAENTCAVYRKPPLPTFMQRA